MRVLVSGSSGLIGTALTEWLARSGHSATRLVRRESRSPDEVRWDPAAGTIDSEALEGHDAVVHLAGVGIGDHRWTPAHKAAARDSRLDGTSLLARSLAGLRRPPKVLASGSAVGVYGDRGDETLTEDSAPPPEGSGGFLADVVREWEAATAAASDAGIRVAHLRSGVVLSARGGALRKQLPAFKAGIGGRIGTGRQYLSWIDIDDEVAAIGHVLTTESLSGPVNVTSPEPVTNAEFTATLARVLHRPAVLPVPRPALHALFGREMVAEMLLAGQRVVPSRLTSSGFRFTYPELEASLRHVLERERPQE